MVFLRMSLRSHDSQREHLLVKSFFSLKSLALFIAVTQKTIRLWASFDVQTGTAMPADNDEIERRRRAALASIKQAYGTTADEQRGDSLRFPSPRRAWGRLLAETLRYLSARTKTGARHTDSPFTLGRGR